MITTRATNARSQFVDALLIADLAIEVKQGLKFLFDMKNKGKRKL